IVIEIVVGNDPLAYAWPRICGNVRWKRHGRDAAHPALRQIAVLIGKGSVVLPTDTEIEGEARVDFEVVLEKCTSTRRAVAMNDPLRSAPRAEQALVDVAGLSGGCVLRPANQKVIKTADSEVSARSGPGDRPIVSFPFEADAHGVAPAGNRNLI